jgi:hypothetical protein
MAAAAAIALYPTYTGASCLADAVRGDPSGQVRERCLQLLRSGFSESAMRNVGRPTHDITEDGRLIADLLQELEAPDAPDAK